MLKKLSSYFLILSIILLSGCTTTFRGSLFVITIGDIILYVFLAFILAFIIAFRSRAEKRTFNFWLWFILGLVLTPLSSFIYLLILFSRKKR